MEKLKFKTEADELRRRLLTWLGKKCKSENWRTLLEAEYNLWLLETRRIAGFPLNPLKLEITAEAFKRYWQNAIKRAALEQLQELDNLIAGKTERVS